MPCGRHGPADLRPPRRPLPPATAQAVPEAFRDECAATGMPAAGRRPVEATYRFTVPSVRTAAGHGPAGAGHRPLAMSGRARHQGRSRIVDCPTCLVSSSGVFKSSTPQEEKPDVHAPPCLASAARRIGSRPGLPAGPEGPRHAAGDARRFRREGPAAGADDDTGAEPLKLARSLSRLPPGPAIQSPRPPQISRVAPREDPRREGPVSAPRRRPDPWCGGHVPRRGRPLVQRQATKG